MNKSFILILALLIYSCSSNELKEPHKYNYTTSGTLTDDCFQVIVTASPDREMKAMADQRENSFIKAKDSIPAETEKQILLYYTAEKSLTIETLPDEKLKLLKEKAVSYSKKGIIDQEYYLIDNSAVLVYRIFKKGIKNEILNN
jgi:predicted membrane metal-binding protein